MIFFGVLLLTCPVTDDLHISRRYSIRFLFSAVDDIFPHSTITSHFTLVGGVSRTVSGADQ